MFCNDAIWSMQQAGALGRDGLGGGPRGTKGRGLSSRLQPDRAGTQPSPPEAPARKCPGVQAHSPAPTASPPETECSSGERSVSPRFIPRGTLRGLLTEPTSGCTERPGYFVLQKAGWLLSFNPPAVPPQERV